MECSKYVKEPNKQHILHQLALGRGGLFIKKNNNNILVTSDGFFNIPAHYNEEAHKDLMNKIWKTDDYSKMEETIKTSKLIWGNTKKKDKLYLFTQYAARVAQTLPQSNIQKINLQNKNTTRAITEYTHFGHENADYLQKRMIMKLLALALLLKLIKPNDITYTEHCITNVIESLTTQSTYDEMQFHFDYTLPLKESPKHVNFLPSQTSTLSSISD